MRVNSALSSVFNHQLAVKCGIAVAILVCFCGVSFSGTNTSEPSVHRIGCVTNTIGKAGGPEEKKRAGHEREMRARQVNLMIREIGHRLLRQAGDFTSPVLPVAETNQGTFVLKFEKGFVFSHDSLMSLSHNLLPKRHFPSGYTVTVLDCMNAEIVYGFQLNTNTPDILACQGRSQPPGCYLIEFTFPDFYDNTEAQRGEPGQPVVESKSVSGVLHGSAKHEGLSTTHEADIDKLTKQLKSFAGATQGTNPKLEDMKPTDIAYPFVNLVSVGMLILLGVAFLINRVRKIARPAPVLKENLDAKHEFVAVPTLGKFVFDVRGQRLVLESDVVSLTDKECKILELLNKSFGELISRETLMQEIWINEGVITGRSLDMFISKLRKKLRGDPELKITNIHGKGYKLENPTAERL